LPRGQALMSLPWNQGVSSPATADSPDDCVARPVIGQALWASIAGCITWAVRVLQRLDAGVSRLTGKENLTACLWGN
jgi:hypothetical protein